MGNSVIVRYSRKRTDKLPDGAFDTLEVGGEATIDVPDDTDPMDVWKVAFGELKESVDANARSGLPVAQTATMQAVPATGDTTTTVSAPAAPLSWIEKQVQQNTQAIQERVQAPVTAQNLDGEEAHDEYGTPPRSAIRPMEAVMFAGCKVFENTIKPASNGNLFVNLRIGKRGPDGIPGQYVTAKSWEGPIIEACRSIREGDFVDVYGFFKPWKNNPERFDLELQKIERSQG